MIHSIREKKKFVFNHVRVNPDTIRLLAAVIDQEVSSAQEQDKLYTNINTVEAYDDSAYESQGIHIFVAGGLLDQKSIAKVSMQFKLFDYSQNIEVQVVHAEKDVELQSYIMVSGDDANWVNGLFNRLSEIIEESEEQPRYHFFHNWPAITVWVAFMILYYRLVHKKLALSHTDLAGLSFLVVIFLSGFGAHYLNEYLASMYPPVELQTGAQHQQSALQRRKRLGWIITMILLPLLLAVVYDLAKYIL